MKRERTAEERERARLERETKRAAREGRPPPTALSPTELPPEEPARRAPAPEPIAEPEPVAAPAPEPISEAEPVPLPEPIPEPEPVREVEPEPEIEPEPEPEPEAEAPVEEAYAVDHDQDTEPDLDAVPEPPPDDDFDPLPHGDREAPVAPPPATPIPLPAPSTPQPARDAKPRRGRFGRRRAPEATAARPPQAPPPYRPSLATTTRSAAAQEALDRRREAGKTRDPGRRRIGVGAGALLVVLAVLVAGVGWFAFSLFQPFKGDGSGSVPVKIAQGESVGDIAHSLERRGVISSAFFFEARATIAGRRDDFKAGNFTLKKGMSHIAAMDAISKGPPPDVTQIVIPEGRARRQVAALVKGKLPGDYFAQTRSSKTFDVRRYGAPRGATLEGFLFPATYELKKGSRVASLVDEQLGLFKRNIARVDLKASKRRKLTAYDVLIVASMIDQEAQVAKERPVIASVIYNRLRQGIPLGIDATIRYATNNRTRPLTQSQLAIDSPYNTRTRRGLPPGPIGSPGIASIRAAAAPASTKFLFYVVKPGKCGQHAFSRTDAEFQRDVARYNNARAKRGGKSPTRC